jgi:predicted Rossmann fold nucleotide-binding protein DprA/Smf involved in DNA uptake
MFGLNEQRITRALAEKRNRLVASFAQMLIIPHAAPNSNTLALCGEVLRSGGRILTFDDNANKELIKQGAQQIRLGDCEAQ